MFFVLSKILGLFTSPILWIIALLIGSTVRKNQKTKRNLIISAIFLTLFFSNSFIFNSLLQHYEYKAVGDNELSKCYDYGIVLSGMSWYNNETQRVNFLQSSDRIWQAVRLYHQGKIKKILITGGPASFFDKDTTESAVLKKFLVEIGIPDSIIITEEKSRNTYENALFTSQLLTGELDAKLLLITSAIHIRRSKACFEKVGLTCDIYPTDIYSGVRQLNFEYLFVPSARTLFDWNAFIHELIGMVSYKLMGYV